MREIKFRAFSVPEKRMYTHCELDARICDISCVYDDKVLILMQYTGLKDKNGRKIYEGDVVKTESGLTQEIYWDYAAAGYYTRAAKPSYEFSSISECEIIGNIYENPELVSNVVDAGK